MASAASPQFQSPARLRRPSIAWGIAIALGGGLATPSAGPSLPGLPWASALLCAAVVQDLRHRRISNWLTFPAMVAALAAGFLDGGELGLTRSIVGLGLTFMVLFIPYAARGLGAGDVKACMALGALWGATVVIPILVWVAAIAGTVATGTLAWDTMRRGAAGSGARNHPRRRALPLAPAIAAAVIAYRHWGAPWPSG